MITEGTANRTNGKVTTQGDSCGLPSGPGGSAYSQMEVADGRKLTVHRSAFVRFPLIDRPNEFLLVWTTTPWTLTSTREKTTPPSPISSLPRSENSVFSANVSIRTDARTVGYLFGRAGLDRGARYSTNRQIVKRPNP